MITERVCYICKQLLPIEKFSKEKRTKDGYKFQCKSCDKVLINNYLVKKRAEDSEYDKKTRQKFKSKRYKYVWASNTIGGHKRNGFTCDFRPKELEKFVLNIDNCQFCNKQFNWMNTKVSNDSPTMERLNNEKIIKLDKIAIICHQCNCSKSNLNFNEFVEYCSRIYNKFKDIHDGKEMLDVSEVQVT